MAPGIVRRSPSACSKAVRYRSRPRSSRIEPFFNRIKHFRHLATRYETHAANFSLYSRWLQLLWLSHNEPMSQPTIRSLSTSGMLSGRSDREAALLVCGIGSEGIARPASGARDSGGDTPNDAELFPNSA